MDKKLLLAIQSVCNADGVKIPWDKVGKIMGDKISDGAVIQHLAKLRQRMVSQGLSVPPPLRRGGGSLISTGYSGGSSIMRSSNQNGGPPAPAQRNNEDDEDEFDVDKATDMEEDYGQARSKRTKRTKKNDDTAWKLSAQRKGNVKKEVKIEDSDEDEDMIVKVENGKKRKREVKQTGLGMGKGLPAQRNLEPGTRARRSSIDYAELNGGYDSNDEYGSGEGEEYVGAGAPYMKFAESEDDGEDLDEQSSPQSQSKAVTPSKVVVLQVGKFNQFAQPLEESKHLNAVATYKSGASSAYGDLGSEADHHQRIDLRQPTAVPSGPGRGDGFGSTYMNSSINAYHQQDTIPSFREVSHLGPWSGVSGHSHGFSTFENQDWFGSTQYARNIPNGQGMPGSYPQPPMPLNRITIPQQANIPGVELEPPSAASTISDQTPVLVSGDYYTLLDEGMEDTDNFNQAYREPSPADPTLGSDDGLDLLHFL